MRTSLHIGINSYPGTGADLYGCVNDAPDWADLLRSRGFAASILLDQAASHTAILEHLQNFIGEADAGDTLVITYSGHGTWVPDKDGDEADRRDEALCPSDLMSAGPITDDQLYRLFTMGNPLANLAFISDSCHSGTVSRLLPPMTWQSRPRQVRFLSPSLFLSGPETTRARALEQRPIVGGSRASALLLSGCKDNEYSYDAWFGDRPNGAFTRAAIDAYAQLDGDATYRMWWNKIRLSLPSQEYPQAPQLYATESQKISIALR